MEYISNYSYQKHILAKKKRKKNNQATSKVPSFPLTYGAMKHTAIDRTQRKANIVQLMVTA
jgi:hypothetical protein